MRSMFGRPSTVDGEIDSSAPFVPQPPTMPPARIVARKQAVRRRTSLRSGFFGCRYKWPLRSACRIWRRRIAVIDVGLA